MRAVVVRKPDLAEEDFEAFDPDLAPNAAKPFSPPETKGTPKVPMNAVAPSKPQPAAPAASPQAAPAPAAVPGAPAPPAATPPVPPLPGAAPPGAAQPGAAQA